MYFLIAQEHSGAQAGMKALMLGFLLEGQPGRTLLLSFSGHLHWLRRQNKRWEAWGVQCTSHVTEKAQSSLSAGLAPWITVISTQTLFLHYLLKTSGDSTAG